MQEPSFFSPSLQRLVCRERRITFWFFHELQGMHWKESVVALRVGSCSSHPLLEGFLSTRRYTLVHDLKSECCNEMFRNRQLSRLLPQPTEHERSSSKGTHPTHPRKLSSYFLEVSRLFPTGNDPAQAIQLSEGYCWVCEVRNSIPWSADVLGVPGPK